MIRRDAPYTVEFWHEGKGDYKAAAFRRNRVVQLETDSALYKTPQGLSVRSTLGQIRRALGRMRVISYGRNDPDPEVAGHAANYYDSRKCGLAFEIDMGYRADLSASAVPFTLFVHRRGQPFREIDGEEVWSAR